MFNITRSAIVALIVILLLLGLFILGDNIGATVRNGNGVVVEKKEIDALVLSTNPKKLEKELVHPKLWKLCIQIEEKIDCLTVSEYQYAKVANGDHVRISYTVGFLTNNLHIKSLNE